jgi:hypothetical protein
LPARDVVRIVNELCAALAVAHRAAVIHRDVKPANIFLQRHPGSGELVKLLDFGVAKVRDSELTAPTLAGTVLGTPEYMSPEQFLGDAHIDARADLWSVGVVAYRMLVGHTPFSRGPAAELAARIMGQEPTPASSLVPSLPRQVDAWFEHALAKRPRDRFSDATELTVAFAAAIDSGQPTRPPPLDFRVKGAALRATVSVIRELHDERFVQRMLDRCSPETIRVLRAPILVSSWYPGALFVDVSRAAVSLAGPGILRKLGELSAEEALGTGGFYELFVKVSRGRGAARFLQSSEDIFRLYYDRGAWQVEELAEGWARCRFVEGARYPAEVAERLLGYLDRGLALVGARDVKLDTESHDNDMIVHIAWHDAPDSSREV